MDQVHKFWLRSSGIGFSIEKHFKEKHSERPDICLIILNEASDGLGGHVDQSPRFRRAKAKILHRGRPAEVAELQILLIVENQVLGLQVPEDKPLRVEKRQTFGDLSEEPHDLAERHGGVGFDIAVEISVGRELEDDDNSVVLGEKVQKIDDPFRSQLRMQLDLIRHQQLIVGTQFVHRKDLQGNFSAKGPRNRSVNSRKGSESHLLGYFEVVKRVVDDILARGKSHSH